MMLVTSDSDLGIASVKTSRFGEQSIVARFRSPEASSLLGVVSPNLIPWRFASRPLELVSVHFSGLICSVLLTVCVTITPRMLEGDEWKELPFGSYPFHEMIGV